jgi:hypothetical protein
MCVCVCVCVYIYIYIYAVSFHEINAAVGEIHDLIALK